MCFKKTKIPTKQLHSAAYPDDPNISGRLLCVREKGPKGDLLHVGAYFPPSASPKAKEIAIKMTKWLQDIFNKLPTRCLPIIYMDLNSKMGQYSGVAGKEKIQASQGIITWGWKTKWEL